MQHIVRIHKKNEVIEKSIESGTNLLKFLRKHKIDVNASCSGNGTCGKCKIKMSGLAGKVTGKEKELLGEKSINKGYRLSCYNKINSDIDIYIDAGEEKAQIATDIIERDIVKFEPVVAKNFTVLEPPGIGNQTSDIDRLLCSNKKIKASNSINILRELPEILRQENFKVTLVTLDKKVIGVEAGDTTKSLFGIAMDIGTTTIVAYLINMVTGEKIDAYSILNPQRQYGADVVSRINYTLESENGLSEINNTISSCINQMIKEITSRNKINSTDVYAIVLVGNTTMIHFLMKLPARNIAVSPFIPVTTRMYKLKSDDIGLHINPYGYSVIIPSVSAYIGADTTAAVLSCGMYMTETISLLIDIGTNGEIVLGNNNWLLACSTAAGPAFEGSHIRNGLGGIAGAIDKVVITSNVEYRTIGNEKPIGICGSGIVDIAAEMLSKGIMNGIGRILSGDEECMLDEELKKRLIKIGDMNSFLVVESSDCSVDNDIVITQKDIRELQNAKAAIAAGIRTLVKKAGIELEDITRVYLAGGFGSYININSALKIGLIPRELSGKIESIGNAAGAGAIECLTSVKSLKATDKIKKLIEYVELSASSSFMDEYIECMCFDEQIE